jgi:hypothetical protein
MSDGVLIALIGTAGTVFGAVVTTLISRSREHKGTTPGKEIEVRRVGRYDGVIFHFVGGDEEDEELTGTVILRDGEMILDIPGGWGPYLIIGKLHGSRFQGPSTARGRSKRVEAAWADLGERYVGWWIEDGLKYLFSFELLTA